MTIARGGAKLGTARIRLEEPQDAVVILCGPLSENDWSVYVPGTMSPEVHTYGTDQEGLQILASQGVDIQVCVEEALRFITQRDVQQQIERVASALMERTTLTEGDVRVAAGFVESLCAPHWRVEARAPLQETGLICPSCSQPVATVERTASGLLFECPACGNRWSAEPLGSKPHRTMKGGAR